MKGRDMKMKWFGVVGLLIILVAFWGCTASNEPDTNSAFSEVREGSTIAEGQMDLLEQSGHPLEECKAIFSLGWKEVFVPMMSGAETAGHAFAVAFEAPTSQRPRPFGGGIDMGAVYIHYQTTQLEMLKLINPEGGVVYSLGHRPAAGTTHRLEYIPNETYEFEVTGSAHFDPLQIDLISPPALLDFTSHAMGDTISASSDLTLIWSGGLPDSGVVLHIHPGDVRPLGTHPAPGQMPLPGSRPPRGGPGPGGLMPPPPPISPHSIIVMLDDNPGTYTVAASELQNLVNQTGAPGLICGISQVDVKTIDHNGERVQSVLHNGDRVGLLIQ